jgi:hypothetical protein
MLGRVARSLALHETRQTKPSPAKACLAGWRRRTRSASTTAAGVLDLELRLVGHIGCTVTNVAAPCTCRRKPQTSTATRSLLRPFNARTPGLACAEQHVWGRVSAFTALVYSRSLPKGLTIVCAICICRNFFLIGAGKSGRTFSSSTTKGF